MAVFIILPGGKIKRTGNTFKCEFANSSNTRNNRLNYDRAENFFGGRGVLRRERRRFRALWKHLDYEKLTDFNRLPPWL